MLYTIVTNDPNAALQNTRKAARVPSGPGGQKRAGILREARGE
jgi:hypothetical protein